MAVDQEYMKINNFDHPDKEQPFFAIDRKVWLGDLLRGNLP